VAIKQVLVVRKDLNMRKGKIGAQCAHAALKVFFDRGSLEGKKRNTILKIRMWKDAIEWYQSAFTKICVYVESEAELIEIYQKACKADIPSSIITDSGRTEFRGVPTKTVVAVGPFDSGAIDKVTGHLKLY